MKIALYARVSDDKLKEDGERRQDVERQVSDLSKYCNKMGWDFDVFKEDGKSAYKEDYQSRPQFVKLLREIRGHHYQIVLVEDMTRWSRRLEDGLKTLRETCNSGCTVTSTKEGEFEVTSANGWMKSALCFMFAEWGSRIMSDKVKSGMARIPPCLHCGLQHRGRIPDLCKIKGRSKPKTETTPEIEGVADASPSNQ